MQNNTILVSKIQTFSVHDGPGIRTTVFLKGCNLNCPWCANPENIRSENEYWFDVDKCITGEGNGCSLSNDCNRCPIGAKRLVAKEYTADSLYDELIQYLPFYDDGGITFSGGEALLQIENLEPVLIKLKKSKINICFETALHVANSKCMMMLKYADELFVDIKNVESPSSIFLSNLRMVDDSGIKYIIRVPLVKPYTYNEDNIKKINDLLRQLHPVRIETFHAHALARKKYLMLGLPFTDYNNVSDEETVEAAKAFGGAEVLTIN